jgi:cytochrome c-type biogenesis protein CcmH
MLWVFIALLAVLAVVIVLSPLVFKSHSQSGGNWAAVDLLVKQLKKIDADALLGNLSKEEAFGATVEIKKRLLAAAQRTQQVQDGGPRSGRWLVLVMALVVPAGATGLYSKLGAPEVPGLAFADRRAERAEAGEIADLAAKMQDRLQQDPNGGPTEGWALLGQTYVRMGRFEEAAAAFETVTQRSEAGSSDFSRLAEALIFSKEGVVTPEAEIALDRAQALDSRNPAAVFYKAVATDQAGQPAVAFEMLAGFVQSAEGSVPWKEAFIAQANRIGGGLGYAPLDMASTARTQLEAPGPSAEDITAAAQMSSEDRSAFIRSMVERLAARLANQPEDPDGWTRLGNAYRVLGDTDAARTALVTARDQLASRDPDDPCIETVNSALAELEG